MKCQYCNEAFEEYNIEEHHAHPKFMDNPKGLGRKVYLCKKCHNILHLTIPTILWDYISKEKKQECIDAVIKFTTSRIKEDDPKTNRKI